MLMKVGFETIVNYIPERVRKASEMSYLNSIYDKLPPQMRATTTALIPEEVRIYDGQPGDRVEHMAIAVAKKALEEAKLSPNDIDFVIGAGISTHTIGLPFDVPMVNISTTCNSFVASVYLAWNLVASGKYQRILIVASCALAGGDNGGTTDLTDPTSPHFGDDAAACIVSTKNLKCEFLSYYCETYGEAYHNAYGTIRPPANPELAEIAGMKNEPGAYFNEGDYTAIQFCTGTLGNNVLVRTVTETLKKADLELKDVSYIITHHVGRNIEGPWIQSLVDAGLPASTYKNRRNEAGNTGHTDIPADIARYWKSGELKKDMIIAMWVPGSGIYLSCLALRWLV